MPTFEFTSPEGKTYEVTGPEGATSAQAFSMLQQQIKTPQAQSLPPSVRGVPTFDPQGSQRAQALKETITGPETGTQGYWFKRQQQIEKQLRGQGKTDQQIQSDPTWQEAAKNLSRASSAGTTGMAVGAAAGDIAAAPLGAAAGAIGSTLAHPVSSALDAISKTPIVGRAIGREAAAARIGMQKEATEGVTNLIKSSQSKVATNKALTDSLSSRPDANVLEIQKPVVPDGTKVSQVRANVRSIDAKLTDATTKLQTAQRTLSSLDKYAGTNRSEYMIRSARKNLNMAQKEVNRLTEEKTNAVNDLNEETQTHRTQIEEAKKSSRYQATTQKQISSQAKSAQVKLGNLSALRAQINAPKATPSQIASAARSIGKELLKSGHLSESQYQAYLGRVNSMIEKAASTADARKRLLYVLGGLTLTGAVGEASGLSYEIRRMFQR